MDDSDKEKFAELMMGLGAMYKQSITNVLLTLYWNGLKRFEFKRVNEAINAHINNPDCGQFMPKIADVVRFLEGGLHSQALLAWTKVTKAISQFGVYSTLVFDNPIIHVVLSEMGGWVALCRLTEKELTFRSHEFEKRFVGYLLRAPKNFPRQMTGICEHQNKMSGCKISPPILLGDVKNAALIYEQGNETIALPHLLATTENMKSIAELTKTLTSTSTSDREVTEDMKE